MEAKEAVKQAVKEIILDEDPIIEGQEWFCVSFLSPKRARNTNITAFKFRGAFPTEVLARERAKYISEHIDPNFHIFVGSAGKWILYDPDAEKVKDQEYHEKELNNLMKMAVEEREEAKQEADGRKKKLVDDGKAQFGEQRRANKIKERLQKKVMKKKADEKPTEVEPEKEVTPEKQEAVKLNAEVDADAKKIEDEKRKLVEREQKIKNMCAAFERLKDQKK